MNEREQQREKNRKDETQKKMIHTGPILYRDLSKQTRLK